MKIIAMSQNLHCPEGALNGVFSVSPTKKVHFSQGNLQYHIPTKTWKLADNQLKMVYRGALYHKVLNGGYIDQYGWGRGDDPVKSDDEHYLTYSEWGKNPIEDGGYRPDMWFTLTKDEWSYVLEERNTLSGARYVKATLPLAYSSTGLLLFPDDWDPGELQFNNLDQADADFGVNTVDKDLWKTLEMAGVVFLPAIKHTEEYTEGDNIFNMRTVRTYYYLSDFWTATQGEDGNAYCLHFEESCVCMKLMPRSFNAFVRLVCDVEHDGDDLDMSSGTPWTACDMGAEVPEGATGGVFSIGPTNKVFFSKGNLQYQASTGMWRFAERQFDFLGKENEAISLDNTGWMDLFGWGTGDNPTKYVDDFNNYKSYAEWGDYYGRGWRTLTRDEWVYVLKKRSTRSGLRYAKAVVGNVPGVILLPDNWDRCAYKLNGANRGREECKANVISAAVWDEKFSSAGAVFLPITGEMSLRKTFYNVEWKGGYWSSSDVPNNINSAFFVYFYNDGLSSDCESNRSNGRAVRLVRPI